MLPTGRRIPSHDYSQTLFGQALTPVLPTVVLVLFNNVTTLALAQLGIRNNYSNNLSLRDRWGSSDEPKAGRPSELSHEVIWLAWVCRSGTTRPTESSLSGPQGLSIYTFMGGAIPGHRLRMRESWITQAHGAALMVPPTMSTDPYLLPGFFRWQCRWLGGNGTGRPRRLEYPWHMYDLVWSSTVLVYLYVPVQVKCIAKLVMRRKIVEDQNRKTHLSFS